ncbi:MATE family efflux transporter [Thermoflexibacter ruber]|uniref:Multidrug-efflux transporter n=1 Tax=Thermoflexibacter ruber TaxID=1003 RepID=A0A1I2FIM9_9BACT|nr:MATE family efflux transporter [Thermoflexibacter ruber]SFF05272.1 multidrug resistance protein, MATE family [Thermoflexibacter ruber]
MFTQAYFSHYRQTIHLALPIIAGQLSQILISLADNTMVGNFDSQSLAASALANAIFWSIFIVGIGITLGLTPPVAASSATGDIKTCQRYFKHGIVLYSSIGFFIFLFIVAISFFLDSLGQQLEVATLARPYLQILGGSAFFVLIFQSIKQFMHGISHTKEPMYIEFGEAGLNILLNYTFIFGNFGFPALGLLGAGIATILARMLGCIALVILFVSSSHFAKYREGFEWKVFAFKDFKYLIKLGVPIGLSMLFETSAFAMSNVMMGWIGADELAAHQIALNVASTTFLVAMGISSATAVRTANQLGLKNVGELRMAGKAGMLINLVFMASCVLIISIFHNVIPMLYVKEVEVQKIASILLIVAALFQLSDGLQVACMGALRGITDVKIPTFITLFAYWGIGIPLGYVLGFVLDIGAVGIWISLFIALTVAAILLTLRFLDKSKRIIQVA